MNTSGPMSDGSEQKKKFFEAHPVVFPVSAGLIVFFVLFAALKPDVALMLFSEVKTWIATTFSWLYIISMSIFLVVAIYLCFSKFGSIRLGPDDARPDFHTLSWFAMLFSAGMGIGMLFYGVYEPTYHFTNPVRGEAGTLGSAKLAMAKTLSHWCLHPWGLYALVGLALAYFGYRRGLPLSFRSVFHPIFGDAIHGRLGDVIDVMAVLATLFGLATSLGLGAKQVNAGLNFVFGLPIEPWIQIVLIACITSMAVASLVSGLDVGIRRLSEFNMGIAGFLLIFLFIAGPTIYLLSAVVENTGAYLQTLPTTAFWTATYDKGEQASWFSSWTVFYWGWWISWSPFVGMFIARVSRGRTIREFIAGVLLVPTAVAIVWMTGFGNTALHQEIYTQVAGDASQIASKYAYQPRPYPMQVLDPETGLPQGENGELVAAASKGQASPTGVMVEATDQTVAQKLNPALGYVQAGSPIYRTKSGRSVTYNNLGVLVNAGNGSLFDPRPGSIFTGRYRSVDKSLNLAGYITPSYGLAEEDQGQVGAVLNPAHTGPRNTTATAMFVMLKAYPWTMLTAFLGTVSVILFFVTSSDSASLVADIIASGGNQDPPVGTRLFWGILEGVLAAVLLLSGGLNALQAGAIALGLPFCLIILLMCYSLVHGLGQEMRGDMPPEQLAYTRGEAAHQRDEDVEEQSEVERV